jgi:hypothetical protein
MYQSRAEFLHVVITNGWYILVFLSGVFGHILGRVGAMTIGSSTRVLHIIQGLAL